MLRDFLMSIPLPPAWLVWLIAAAGYGVLVAFVARCFAVVCRETPRPSRGVRHE